MNKEEKETLQKVANYAEAEKNLVVRRKCIVTALGTMVCMLCIIVGYVVLPGLPEDSFFRNDRLWLAVSVIGLVGLWGLVIYGNRKNAAQNNMQNK